MNVKKLVTMIVKYFKRVNQYKKKIVLMMIILMKKTMMTLKIIVIVVTVAIIIIRRNNLEDLGELRKHLNPLTITYIGYINKRKLF